MMYPGGGGGDSIQKIQQQQNQFHFITSQIWTPFFTVFRTVKQNNELKYYFDQTKITYHIRVSDKLSMYKSTTF